MKKYFGLLFLLIGVYACGYSQPANDDCSGATIISIPANGSACVIGNSTGATSTTWANGAVCGYTTWTDDVWFTFVSSGTYNVITVQPTGGQPAQQLGISVYTGGTGGCSTLQGLGTYCAIASTNGGADTVYQTGTAGVQYWIEISGFSGDGTFELCVNSTNPPASPGGTCATAAQLCSLAPFSLGTGPAGTGSFDPNCFLFAPFSSVWYEFTVGATGSLAWSCQPTEANTELDWAFYDITTGGCAALTNSTTPACCNYHYSGSLSYPIGMVDTSTTACGIQASNTDYWQEFCPSQTVTAGHTYVIFINNFSDNQSGWNFNFAGSTFELAPTATLNVTPDTICGGSGTVNLANSSVAAISQLWTFGDGDSSTAANPGTHTYNQPGIYLITLTDSSNTGCTSTLSQSVAITPNPAVTIQNDTTCPGGSAVLTAVPTVTGGTYLWSNNATTPSITVTPGGNVTYTVTYTSPTGCTASATGSVTIVANPTASITANPPGICPGGSSVLTASSGQAYRWNTAAITQSITVSPASNTSYQVTVDFAPGCSATATTTVTVGSFLGASISSSSSTICLGQSTTLIASPGGDTYLWSTAQISDTIVVTPAGTAFYDVTVTDAGGCTASAESLVTILPDPPAAITASPDSVCPGFSSTLSATAGGLTYVWSDSETTTSIIVTPPSTAVYDVTITGTNGCTASATDTVTVLSNPPASIAPSTDTICPGASATLVSSPGAAYLWSATAGSAITENVTVTPASFTTYDVTVTNPSGCTVSSSATVSVATPSADITPAATSICLNDSTMLGANTGTAYLWSDAEVTQNITISPAATATYDVTVTFSNGCTASASAVVTVNSLPPAAITPASVIICTGASTQLIASGGSSYLWSTNQTATSITVSPASTTTYSITADNVNSCTATASAVVTVSAPYTLSPVITNVSCNGGANGAINVTVTGTTQPYSYTWSDGGTGSSITNLSAGMDTVTVSDVNSCPVIAAYTVTQPLALVLGPPTITNIGCTGGNTGSITANPSGGTQGYTYNWVEQSNSATFTGRTISGLAADNYGLQVTDANGCSAGAAYQITNVPLLAFTTSSTAISCASYTNGTAMVNLTSGTPPFRYSWSSGNGTPNDSTMNGIGEGGVYVTVTDANNCSGTASFLFQPPMQIYIETTGITDVSCFGGNNGRISVFYYGGTGSLAALWSNGPGGSADSNLAAGSYTVTVTDSNLCTAALTDTVSQPASINLVLDSSNSLCYGLPGDGSAWAVAAGGVAPYSYKWSSGDLTDTTSRTLSTNGSPYFCTVTDANQCTATASVNIGQPTQLYINPSATAVKCANDPHTGTISVADTGGTPPYSYCVTQDSFNYIFITDSIVQNLDTGWYVVLVRDGNGCTHEVYQYVPDAIADSFSVTSDSTLCYGPNYNDGAISVVPTIIANAPYEFALDSGIYQYTGSFYGVSAGNHTVWVINRNQCMDTIPVVVYQPLPVVAEVTPDTVILQPGQNKQVQVSSINANNPFYNWTPAEGLSCIDCPDPMVNSYAAGMYTVTVSTVNDSAVCFGSATLWVMLLSHPPVYIPNAFSPNGDGNNDVFMVYGDNISTVDLKVFNRWGELVFETQDPFNGWDGTYKGHLQMPGVFTYMATVTFLDNSQEQKNGSVTLIR